MLLLWRVAAKKRRRGAGAHSLRRSRLQYKLRPPTFYDAFFAFVNMMFSLSPDLFCLALDRLTVSVLIYHNPHSLVLFDTCPKNVKAARAQGFSAHLISGFTQRALGLSAELAAVAAPWAARRPTRAAAPPAAEEQRRGSGGSSAAQPARVGASGTRPATVAQKQQRPAPHAGHLPDSPSAAAAKGPDDSSDHLSSAQASQSSGSVSSMDESADFFDATALPDGHEQQVQQRRLTGEEAAEKDGPPPSPPCNGGDGVGMQHGGAPELQRVDAASDRGHGSPRGSDGGSGEDESVSSRSSQFSISSEELDDLLDYESPPAGSAATAPPAAALLHPPAVGGAPTAAATCATTDDVSRSFSAESKAVAGVSCPAQRGGDDSGDEPTLRLLLSRPRRWEHHHHSTAVPSAGLMGAPVGICSCICGAEAGLALLRRSVLEEGRQLQQVHCCHLLCPGCRRRGYLLYAKSGATEQQQPQVTRSSCSACLQHLLQTSSRLDGSLIIEVVMINNENRQSGT